ncbi:DUF2147 domain-containing protein [Tabrizicola sp.]|uniref:DUF2147 domain-containing protein n=1 Tax=Tabrizicola sp. TaxID=2005166 RepID=UPI0027332F92|nr:DUF2147 domain-containing protein [Tabrizicola sp.]MDP3194744.1 DUF2147 domain-containing protein [Tabrizicola sp.]
MKVIAFAAGFAVMAGMAGADPAEGIWQTRKDDNGNFGHVQIKPCGPAVCGTLIKAFNGEGKEIDSPNVGKRIVWDMVPYANGLYDDGKIWSPDRDKTYNGDMTLAGDSLSVRGCVLGICRDGGTWKRVK